MQRRTFFKYLSAIPALAHMPRIALAADTSNQKTLILVQLAGGNDSLNTFVPITNQAYYDARKTISIDPLTTMPLTRDYG